MFKLYQLKHQQLCQRQAAFLLWTSLKTDVLYNIIRCDAELDQPNWREQYEKSFGRSVQSWRITFYE